MNLPLSMTTFIAALLFAAWAHAAGKPSDLFIVVDDLNDWIGCMRGPLNELG